MKLMVVYFSAKKGRNKHICVEEEEFDKAVYGKIFKEGIEFVQKLLRPERGRVKLLYSEV